MFCFRESKIVLHPGANAVNYEQNKRHEEYNIGTFIQVKNISFRMQNRLVTFILGTDITICYLLEAQ